MYIPFDERKIAITFPTTALFGAVPAIRAYSVGDEHCRGGFMSLGMLLQRVSASVTDTKS